MDFKIYIGSEYKEDLKYNKLDYKQESFYEIFSRCLL